VPATGAGSGADAKPSATGGGLSYSTDGRTFTTVTNGLGSTQLRGVYVVGNTVYVATAAGLSAATVTNGTGVVTGSAAFTDPAGRTLSYTTTGASTGGGTVSIDAATGAFTFTPSAAQRAVATANTTDSFTITASNGVNTREQTVTVAVAAQ
jgi:VCBS repeat-containing protein